MYKWGYAYSFCQIIQGLRLFKELRLFQTLEWNKLFEQGPVTIIVTEFLEHFNSTLKNGKSN